MSLLTQELMVPNFLNYFLLVIINLCFFVSEQKKNVYILVLISDVKVGPRKKNMSGVDVKVGARVLALSSARPSMQSRWW